MSSSDLAVLSEPGHGRKSPRVASLIASDISIEGDLRGDGELQVDGVIRGDVSVARLTIGESGQVEGLIHAESVEVRGRVLGAVTAKQVRLHASAHVDGDITHEQLTMEAGAFFEGRSLKFQRTPLPVTGDVIDISAAS
ncbi:MAG: polymer-forming cytoskeletal protein [Caulobacteraceae bacterium]|nr:polymer-forming cytoskeletal protein [Caulobacteraceae bacterium]